VPSVLDRHHLDQEKQPAQPIPMVFVHNEPAALAHRHAVKMLPRKDPATGRTIPEVARETEERVQDLMQAFFTVDNTIILDNKTAKPIPLCTLGSASAFPAEDVEATCRIVFQKMMVQCQRGYTGYQTQDGLRDGQKGVMVSTMKPVDKDGSCRERFNAIRTTLRDWKSVCAAIMYSDDAILGRAAVIAASHGTVPSYGCSSKSRHAYAFAWCCSWRILRSGTLSRHGRRSVLEQDSG
jgi:hypothetical protein